MTAYGKAPGDEEPVHLLAPGGSRTKCGEDTAGMVKWAAGQGAHRGSWSNLCTACLSVLREESQA